MQERTSDSLKMALSILQLHVWVERACPLTDHIVAISYIGPKRTSKFPHKCKKPRISLATASCLWELQLSVPHFNEGRQRGLSISHILPEKPRGKRDISKTFFPCPLKKSKTSLSFSDYCLLSSTVTWGPWQVNIEHHAHDYMSILQNGQQGAYEQKLKTRRNQ